MKNEKEKQKQNSVAVNIKPPNFQTAVFELVGTAPYVQQRFSEKARQQMEGIQIEGPTGKKGRKKQPKNFEQNFRDALYESAQGWHGIPASAFRNASISACRVVGFKMTHAKLGLFIIADGYDRHDRTPLVRIVKGQPFMHKGPVRLPTGVADIRARPMWEEGWEAKPKIKFDADMFTLEDVTNLLLRVGEQVGVGEGRPDSPRSAGMGWGTFRIKGKDEK